MAKTFNNLFPEICSLENLTLAANKTRKRKTRKESTERFELHRERFVGHLQHELLDGTYRPGRYRQFYIHDPKKRLISAAPYRDRVVHHALCNVIAPLIERRFVFDSYSCRKGKGTTAARERCRKFTNRYRYVLKCDIQRYFQSINHEILKAKLAETIACRPTLELCGQIIDSCEETGLRPPFFEGDDLFAFSRKRGLPIGNLTSQLWANLYLDRLDHFVKEELKVPGYARYTDDFLLWSDDKEFLQDCRERIRAELCKERLLLHPVKSRIMQCKEGVPFLGFRFFPQRQPRVTGETKRRFEKRARRQMSAICNGTAEWSDVRTSMSSWVDFSKYGNTNGLVAHYRRNGFRADGDSEDAWLCVARGVLEQQQSEQSALFVSQRQQCIEPEQQQRFSSGVVPPSACENSCVMPAGCCRCA
jgi:retron-type reverse transcriptase